MDTCTAPWAFPRRARIPFISQRVYSQSSSSLYLLLDGTNTYKLDADFVVSWPLLAGKGFRAMDHVPWWVGMICWTGRAEPHPEATIRPPAVR